MDDKKKYEEAERLYQTANADQRYVLESLFPKLRESEDERIRKVIYGWIYTQPSQFFDNGFSKEEMLAWLEKQGEQKPTDKVEPKFKVGDWVIDRQGIVHQIGNVIENVTNHTYSYDIVGGGYFNDNVEGVRLWTIQDAKPGDVLNANGAIFIYRRHDIAYVYHYCCLNLSDEFIISENWNELWNSNSKIYPATKEQRELLFQKVKEAGYEWDAEKKELKKVEQKPAWNEEDETMATNIIIMLKEGASLHFNKNDIAKGVDWLKSLKQRIGG